MNGRFRWGVAAAALVALAAPACGGGPSMEEYTAEANAICEEHRARIDEAASQVLAGGQLPSEEEFGRLAQETIIPELRSQFEELREVEPADEVAEEFEAYVSQGEQAVAEMEEDPSVITNPANFQEVNRQADAAGLSQACYIGPGG